MKFRSFIFLCLFGLCLGPITIFSEQPNSNHAKRVIIFDIPRFDLAEVTPETPFLVKMLSTSSVGLVTIPTIDYPLKPEQIYLYFNSKSLLKVPSGGYQISNATERIDGTPVKELYQTFFGKRTLSQNAVNLDWEKIIQMNNTFKSANLGYFGGVLHSNSGHTAAIGNADAVEANRFGAAMVMDFEGVIDYGAVGRETLQADPLFPSGVRTNSRRIIQYYRNFRKKADAMVITLGDLERIESFRDRLIPSQKDYYRKLTLQRYEWLIKNILKTIDSNSTIVVVFTCLQPKKPHIHDNGLTPVIIRGPNFQGGLLYSKNTRKKGQITYPDLCDTLLSYISPIQPEPAFLPIRAIGGDWQNIIIKQLGLVTHYSFRWPLLTTWIVCFVGIIILLVAGFLIKLHPVLLRALGWGFIGLLTIPGTFLVESLIAPIKWAGVIIYTLGISGFLLFGAMFLGKRNLLRALGWVCFFNVILIVADCLSNGYLESKSFLGYTAVSGKRYYGIGNEYMGVFMGSVIVWLTINLNCLGKYASKILWSLVIIISFLFFHPYLGADVGGGMTSVLGLGATTLLWLRKPVRLKETVLLLMLLGLFLAGVGLWDMLVNPNLTSHFGQLLHDVGGRGFNSLFTMVSRKLEMSWWLINYTPLTMVLLVALFAVPLIYRYPSKSIQSWIVRYPNLSAGLLGLNLTALLGFFLNDSGIVAAALIFVYGLAMLLIPLIDKRLITD